MHPLVLLGPFLTRGHAAALAGLAPEEIRLRPDLLRIDGLNEAYFGFQFDAKGIRRDIGAVVLALRGVAADLEIADWLIRDQIELRGKAPLEWLFEGGDPRRVRRLAQSNPPERHPRPGSRRTEL
jgi:hypothetical protein